MSETKKMVVAVIAGALCIVALVWWMFSLTPEQLEEMASPFGPQIIVVNGCQYVRDGEHPLIHAGNCTNEVHQPK